MALRAKVDFYEGIVFSQAVNTNVEHLIGRVSYWLNIDNTDYDLTSNLRLAYGTDYMQDPIEVDRPTGYNGPINYEALRSAAETYIRTLTDSPNSIIQTNGRPLILKDVAMERDFSVEFYVNENSPAW